MARPRVWLPTLAGACALLLGCGEDGDAGPSSATPTRAATATATATVSPVANAQPAPTLASGRWETRATIASGPRQETAVVALGGEVYVLGGFDGSGRVVATVEAYDPRADRWRSVADLPLAMHHANAAVVDGRIYVAGFLTGRGFEADGRAFVYEPERNAWEAIVPLPAGRERGASAVAVVGGRIYVAGGLRGGAVADFSVFDPATGRWAELTDLPARGDHLAAGAIEGVVYVAGGRDGSIGRHRARLDAYVVAERRWEQRASMPTSRGGVASAVLDGRLYVFGGEGDAQSPSGVFAAAEAYDPASDRWEVLPAMRTPRHGMGAAAAAGAIVVPGGGTRQGFGASAVVEAFVPGGAER